MATNPDSITLYWPAITDIPEATVLDCRNRAQAWLAKGYPNLDVRPGSVWGDGQLTPFAYLLAGLETGLGRFMSDLVLNNVAQGIIYNCAFVQQYLTNFAVFPRTTLQAYGIVRLTFSADQDYVIDPATQFNFGVGNIFTPRLSFPGPLTLRQVGVPLTPGTNTRQLINTGTNIYIADIPVTGTMATQISSGDTASLSVAITELTNIAALVNFSTGQPPTSLAQLAQKTQDTFYAASLGSRGGARSFLTKEFPDLVRISPVLNGDAEMTRSTANVLGMPKACLDVYTQSLYTVIETLTIEIPYVLEQCSTAVNRFICNLSLPGSPFKIDSVVAVAAPDVLLDNGQGSVQVFSQSTNAARAPMASAAYSTLEDLWIAIQMPVDPVAGTPLIPTNIATDGSQSAVFQITYRMDPMLPVISDVVASSDAAPVGVDVLCRGFIPIIIDNMTVIYTRKRGTTINLTGAATEITNYLNTVPAPYTDARIYDAMYFAGASNVLKLKCQAHVQWSAGSLFLPASTVTPDVNYAGAVAASYAAHPITINSTEGFAPLYRDVNIALGSATFESIGLRNIGFILDVANLNFQDSNNY